MFGDICTRLAQVDKSSLSHTGKGCNGIMDYGDSKDEWSECSRGDFRAQYALQMRQQGQHCMEGITVEGQVFQSTC